jgi:Holliday junction resolvase
MAIKHKKEKGSRLERKVAQLIREKGLDKNARRMPLSGAFPHLQADIYTSLPVHIEAKNQERVRLWEWWQTVRAKSKFGKDPVLCISANNRPIIAVIDYEYLLNLWKIEQQYLSEANPCG